MDRSAKVGRVFPMVIWSEFRMGEYKLGCVLRMVVDSILPHAKFGLNDHLKGASPFRDNDHREDAPHFTILDKLAIRS